MSPAKRRTLAGLGGADVAEIAPPVPPKIGTPERRNARTVQMAKVVTTELGNSGTTEVGSSEVGSSEVPKYRQLERKDVLLWPRQLHELTILRRVLNRRRGRGQGERLTENTLVRVAIDYLLAHAGELTGTTEDELRRSLGIGPGAFPAPDGGTDENAHG